jgi:hypothetical protein
MHKHPSDPEDYANNKPVEDRLENDPRCDFRHANEGGFGQMFVPVVTHEERIAFETLEAGETVLIARSETIQRSDVLL